jgi:threonylcarbamoyladenosine tRNA methylthiotransferase MtaB
MRVCFTHLGCKLNQAETERLARDFLAAGHLVVGSPGEADLHVVNTCTVTHTAARASRKAARRAPRTVLTGCHATYQPDDVEVDLIVTNPEKDRLLEHVHAAFPDLAPSEVPVPWVRLPFGHTRALVKVEDGCNMRCSFCIIPSTRGRQRSRPLVEVVEEVRSLVEAGYREVVVTGVQISAYRSGDDRLYELVRAILERTEVPRLRLTSIAPWDLDERLLELWSDRRLCRHLHLSLQSGSTETLRRMHRPYTAEGYLGVLDRVRPSIPGVAITTDVIVGFPGESPEEFEESLATVQAARFAKAHVFPFSPRPGTEAADLSGHVHPDEKKARMERMLAVAELAERDFRLGHVGRRETVLWERGGQGLTDNYLRVHCPEGTWNEFSEVEVVGVAEDGVIGRP